MRRGAATALAALGAVGTAVLSGPAVDASAAVERGPAQPSIARLRVEDQDFGVRPGDAWSARLVLVDPDGALDDVIAAASTSTTTPAPTSTTSAAGTPTSSTTARATAPSSATSTSPTEATARTSGGAAAAGVVSVALRSRIDDRGELERINDGDLTPMTDEVDIPLADVVRPGRDGTATIDVTVPISERPRRDTLTVRSPGVYPLTASVHVEGDEVAELTTLVHVLADEPSDDPQLGIAVAAALSEPGPDPGRAAEDAARAELDDLIAYGEQTDAPLSLAFPPSLAALLDEDDGRRRDVEDALADAELLAQPYLELDPSAAIAVDRTGAFSAEVRRGEDAVSRVLPGVVSRRAAWLVQDPISEAAATTLRDPLGYRLLVLDEPAYESMPGHIGSFLDTSLAVEIGLGEGASMQGAVVSPLGRLLDEGASADRTPTETAVFLLGQLLVNRDELGADLRRNVVLATPGFGLPDGPTVAALDRLLDGNPEAGLTTLSMMVGTTDTMSVGTEPVRLELPTAAGPDLSERVQRLDLVRVSAESAASMLTGGDQRQEWLDELDGLLSTGFGDDEVSTQLERITAEIDAVRGSVEPPDPFTFTLTGRDSTLRLNLRNTADEARTVVVRAVSNKLRFPEGDQRVTLEPGVTEVMIPVEARANGASSVEIQVLTPVFGQRIGPSTFLEARVNAITGLGQTITGIAVLLLVTWWYSHFRRRRRARLAALVVVDEYDPGPAVSPDAAEATAFAPTGAGGDRDSLPDP